MVPALQETIAEGEGVQRANTLSGHAAEWGPGRLLCAGILGVTRTGLHACLWFLAFVGKGRWFSVYRGETNFL